MNNDLKNFVSDDGIYVIPVTWENYGTVQITGVKNLQEALDVAKNYIEELPFPWDGEYLGDSFKLDYENEDDLIDAQDGYRFSAYFHNPKAED